MSTFVNLAGIIYPVGAVYQSFNNTSPATLFGGTWSQITSRFLYAANSSNSTGGASTHQHDYGIRTLMYYGVMGCFSSNENTAFQTSLYDSDNNVTYRDGESTRVGTNRVFTNKSMTTAFLDSQGSIYDHFGQTSFNNSLPPYVTCYTWRRTA